MSYQGNGLYSWALGIFFFLYGGSVWANTPEISLRTEISVHQSRTFVRDAAAESAALGPANERFAELSSETHLQTTYYLVRSDEEFALKNRGKKTLLKDLDLPQIEMNLNPEKQEILVGNYEDHGDGPIFYPRRREAISLDLDVKLPFSPREISFAISPENQPNTYAEFVDPLLSKIERVAQELSVVVVRNVVEQAPETWHWLPPEAVEQDLINCQSVATDKIRCEYQLLVALESSNQP